jgi:hypothetical protein
MDGANGPKFSGGFGSLFLWKCDNVGIVELMEILRVYVGKREITFIRSSLMVSQQELKNNPVTSYGHGALSGGNALIASCTSFSIKLII